MCGRLSQRTVRWVLGGLVLLCLALSGVCGTSAAQGTAVTFAWDLDDSHGDPTITASFEAEVNGQTLPCAPVVVLAAERRCGPITVTSGTPHTFRLRGVHPSNGGGEWSTPVSTGPGGLPPGAFTITATLAPHAPEGPRMSALPDGEAILSGRQSASGTWTFPNKTTAGVDRAGTIRFMTATAAGVPTVTWAGAAMTQVSSVVRGMATIYGYQIANPPTAASSVVVTFGGGSTPSGPYTVSSYNGVDQADPIGDVQTAQGTGATPLVTVTTASGALVVDAMDVANVINSVGADQTVEFLDTTGGSDRFGASHQAGDDGGEMSWNTNSGAWSILAFSLNPSASEPEPSDATAAGTSTATATGSALADADAASAGLATATAQGSALADADAASAGQGAASAEGSSLADADATAAGTSTASATSETDDSTATAAGTSTATAVGSSLADADATSDGQAQASAAGSSLADADATSAGTSTATAVGSTAEDVVPLAITVTDHTWTPPVVFDTHRTRTIHTHTFTQPSVVDESWLPL